MKYTSKPSERLKDFYQENLIRYKDFDPNTKQIATLSNMVKKIGEILDELYKKQLNLHSTHG